jgi:hypothetical protein
VTDDELIAAFEDGSLRRECLRHRDHVRMAFLYLCRHPPLEALGHFSAALQRFAAANGVPDRYHETITWALVFLIRERLARWSVANGQAPGWDEFAAANEDLLCWQDSILKKYYFEGTLDSAFARRTFVLPDRSLAAASADDGVRR